MKGWLIIVFGLITGALPVMADETFPPCKKYSDRQTVTPVSPALAMHLVLRLGGVFDLVPLVVSNFIVGPVNQAEAGDQIILVVVG
jgi:hypothetical protein